MIGNRAAFAAWRFGLLLPLLLLVACAQPRDDSLRMGLANAPDNLDPRLASDATSERINRLLYGRLVDFDAAAKPVPAMADWEQLSATHYRFHLRPERRAFHDGRKLQADDVKATFEFILDPVNASPHRSTLSVIERVETRGDSEIDFHLKRRDPLFPSYLGIGIVPAHLAAADHPFNTRPLGNGPFRFVQWTTPERLVLQRLEDGRQVEFLQVKDPNVRIMKLLRGEIDMTQNDLPPELAGYLAAQSGVRVRRGPGTNFTYLGFNLEDPHTGKLEVRRAIAHAIDRQAIIEHLMRGGAQPAQALLPPSHWVGAKGLAPYDFNPQLARQLLRQAGYDEQRPLQLVYKTSSDPFRIRIATIIQQQLAEVGIQVAIRSYDWGTFFGDIKGGRFQIYSLTWVGIKTPDIFRYVFHSESLPPGGANRGRYRSAQADRLIAAAENSGDADRQTALYQQLQALLLRDLPYVPLWYEDQLFAGREDIEGYVLASDGNYDGLRDTHRAAPAAGN